MHLHGHCGNGDGGGRENKNKKCYAKLRKKYANLPNNGSVESENLWLSATAIAVEGGTASRLNLYIRSEYRKIRTRKTPNTIHGVGIKLLNDC